MDKKTYSLLENFMLSCMEDSAHDKEHVYRVLYNALDIAKTESNVDYNILIASCLLHDTSGKNNLKILLCAMQLWEAAKHIIFY